ncbi:MAG: mycofactocin-coupled SDR family oxidoreductase [Gordonia sp. (in: high G+C Gram-positive bacteria)]
MTAAVLAGKVAIVTGAARGQGRSHAVRLAEEGADIIAVDICEQLDAASYPMSTPDDLEETACRVRALGRRIVTGIADVRDRPGLAKAVATGVAELGHLEIVVANAGICSIGSEFPATAFTEVISVDLVGVINTVDVCLPHLRAGASIVCTGSMAAMLTGLVDNPKTGVGAAGYSHAKRGVARFVHDAALNLARFSIRVNAIHPGNIDTPMLQNDAMYRLFRPDLDNPAATDVQAAFGVSHRLPVETIPPRDISEAVLFFASDASRYVTGQQLSVDAGGVLAQTTSGAPM